MTAGEKTIPTPTTRRAQRGGVEDRWPKRLKDEHGNTVEVPSAVAGKVTRWRTRYVDNTGTERTQHFDRKVDEQGGSTRPRPHSFEAITLHRRPPE